jgi:hypothetical protein
MGAIAVCRCGRLAVLADRGGSCSRHTSGWTPRTDDDVDLYQRRHEIVEALKSAFQVINTNEVTSCPAKESLRDQQSLERFPSFHHSPDCAFIFNLQRIMTTPTKRKRNQTLNVTKDSNGVITARGNTGDQCQHPARRPTVRAS